MDSLDDEKMVYFKRKVFKRILVEKNAEDLIVLIWATGELKDDRFLKLLHQLTNHRHSDIRRITYSAIRKIESPSSREVLQKVSTTKMHRLGSTVQKLFQNWEMKTV